MAVTAIYSDLNEYIISANVLLFDFADILQALDNLFNTIPGERLFLPTYGVDLEQYLFELMTESTAFAILSEITNAVNKWEPRVRVNFGLSTVTPDYSNKVYNLNLIFTIPGLEGNTQQFSYQAGITK